jgi:HK97 gp10 family phage protein
MAVHGSLTLKGLDEYLEKLVQAGKDVDKAAANALIAGGDVILAGEQDRVARLTGELASKLERTELKQEGNYISVQVGVSINAEDEIARYGNAQEFGTATMPAHPYIRPAFDEDKGKARAAERKSLEKEGFL